MKLILNYIKKHIGIFSLSMFFLTTEALADLLQPTYMAHIVDDGIMNADISQILHYGMIMFIIALFGAFSAVMRNIFSSRTSQSIGREMRSDIYRNVQRLSLENIDRLEPASIITRITNDVTQVQNFINSCMRIMVKAPITCIGAIILIIVQTPRQVPIMIAILTLSGLIIFFNMKIGYPRFGKMQKALDHLNNIDREFLSSIRVVKAFTAEDLETEKFEKASLDLANAGTSAMHIDAVFSPLINLVVNLGIIGMLWLSKNQESSQIGRLMASVNYMSQILFSLNMFSNILNTAVRAAASSQRISEILNEKPAQKISENLLCPDICGEIDFKDVSFSYAGAEKTSLNHISFHACQGETIGIIGPTGSGKTTLISLIPRFYDASEGEVLIDGNNIMKINEKTLRTAIAIVPQKALLFSGTIMENLKMGREKANEDEVRKAASIACADSFITASEKGYETLLGQGGVNLSGGQKQRLALARALIRHPKILILDDCTSALDAETEAAVLKGLRQNLNDMTTLLISQRISTVMHTDHILCLENGNLQGFGTHEKLMSDCSIYQAIYESQIGGAPNDK